MTAKEKQLLIDSARRTGERFLPGFRKTQVPQSFDDFLSALKAIEASCFDQLKKEIDVLFPGIPWQQDDEFNAEAQQKPAAQHRYWLCDTMDGAIQYLQHIAGWTINLALIEKGEPVFAIVYDPLTGELFHAEKNNGAYLNGNRIYANQKTSHENMVAVLEYGHQLKTSPDWQHKISAAFVHLLQNFGVVRNYGPHGLQLAYLGAGRIDLFVQTDLDTHNWLAGMLIAKEAGAIVMTPEGEPWHWGSEGIVAGNNAAITQYLKTQ